MRCSKGLIALDVLVLFVLSASLFQALAQTSMPGTQESPSYLLRLERTKVGKDVCVLLQKNGQYHLEHHTAKERRIYEGTLNSDELRTISQIITGNQLSNLKQAQIPESMVHYGGYDVILLAVFRTGGWQQLRFVNEDARVPFRDSLDPLLRWLDVLQKRKEPEVSDGRPSSDCQPLKELSSPEQRPSPNALPEPNGPASQTDSDDSTSDESGPGARMVLSRNQNNYIFRMEETKEQSGSIVSTCAIVSASGSYHWVREFKVRGGAKGESRVLDGTLSQPALASIHAILDTPDIKAERSVEAQFGKTARQIVLLFRDEAFLLSLTIPREGEIQNITSWRTARSSLYNFPNSGLPKDHGEKLLQPFRDWLKANMNDKRAERSTNPMNTRCLPE